MLAFPYNAHSSKRCLVVFILLPKPDRSPVDPPIVQIVEIKPETSPHKVSATIGVKEIRVQLPMCSHLDSMALCICGISQGKGMWIPRAAGRPLCQLRSKTSAGRVGESSTKLDASLDGAKVADLGALKMTSQTALWQPTCI